MTVSEGRPPRWPLLTGVAAIDAPTAAWIVMFMIEGRRQALNDRQPIPDEVKAALEALDLLALVHQKGARQVLPDRARPWLTVRQAATELGRSPRRVLQLIEAHKLRGIKPMGVWRVDAEDVASLAALYRSEAVGSGSEADPEAA